MLYVNILFIFAYLWLFYYLKAGWSKAKKSIENQDSNVTLSIVIPYRNEEDNLMELFRSIEIQDYPREHFELILVNDHSEDRSYDLVEEWKGKTPLNVQHIDLSQEMEGKRKALSSGIESAKNELIICSDADTSRGETWLTSISGYYSMERSQLTIAPVLIRDDKRFFDRFQQLEFLSLQITAIAFAGNQNAILCNGANLIFEKKAFDEIGGYRDLPDTVSGDDFFLLFKMKDAGFKIGAIRNKDAAVYTASKHEINEFVSQRVRWAAKTKFATDRSVLLTASFNTLLSIWMMFLPVYEILAYQEFRMSLAIWLVRLLGDFHLLERGSRVFGQRINATDLLQSFAIYPLYISYIFIQSLFGHANWKGRSIN